MARQPKQKKLSACLIVKNEEQYLGGCLDSIAVIADEIVLADTGSTDRTKEIARRYPVQLFEFPWTGDFSAARNAVLARATGEWILVIDADERLSPEDGRQLVGLLKNKETDGYFIRLKCFTSGNMVEWGTQCRLFRNHPRACYRGTIHEQIVDSLRELGAQLQPSDVVIEHLGYTGEPQAVRAKWERNLELLEGHLRGNPGDLLALHQLGRQLSLLGRPETAQQLLREVTARSREPALLAMAHNDLATLAIQVFRDGQSAVEHAQRSLDALPGQSFPCFTMGVGYQLLGQSENALAAFNETRRRQGMPACSGAASETQVEDLRLAEEIFQLLPDGEERNREQRRILALLGKGLPTQAQVALESLAGGADLADSHWRDLLTALTAPQREQLLSVLPYTVATPRLAQLAEMLFAVLTALDHPWQEPRTLINLMCWLLPAGRVLAARKISRVLSQLLLSRQEPDGFLKAAAQLKLSGHPGFAISLLEAGHQAAPGNTGIARALAIEYLGMKKVEAARELLKLVAATGETDVETLYWQALAAIQAGERAAAEDIFNRLQADPHGQAFAERLKKLLG